MSTVLAQPREQSTPAAAAITVGEDVDLIEWYYEQGYSDGMPVVPPTPAKVDAMLAALGGDPGYLECRVPPRWGGLTREVLAINMVMAGCKPSYAPVVRAAMLALCDPAFNLNGVQATTHMACPLLIVNGPIAREIGMNAGCNVFGSGNRANATIGRAIRLILLNVGGGWPGDLDKSTLGHPGKYTYSIAENEEVSPFAPYHVEKGYKADESTVFVFAAEAPHSVVNHVSNDAEGVLKSVCSAMSTFAHNTAVASGHCAVVLGPEHAATIAKQGWKRNDIKNFLWMHSGNKFGELAFNHKYGKVYNRNLPVWYERELDSWIPIVPNPDNIHLFVAGGEAGRFSAFIPGWGNMTVPVLRPIGERAAASDGPVCIDGTCFL
ncbi:MAG: hypothetical protein JWR22_619 [Herminiimonas sp.]|nr:hypothetical protein [Herminiimonas sp.]